MNLESIDIEKGDAAIKRLLKEEKGLSPALVASMEVLLLLISLLTNRHNLNSRNSISHHRAIRIVRRPKKPAGKRKPDGQRGYDGTMLRKSATPDRVKEIKFRPLSTELSTF